MSHSLTTLPAANHKNLKLFEIKHKSPVEHEKEVHSTNKTYMEPVQKQSVVREFNREQTIEQNKKLKQHVIELAGHMQEVLEKTTTRKKKYGINLEEGNQGQTEEQRNEMKKQQLRIIELKSQKFALKKQLEYIWDESAVTDKQNGIKLLQLQLQPLQTQRLSLLKGHRQLQNALHFLKNDEKYTEKIDKTKSQLIKLKQQTKNLCFKTTQNQRLLLKTHERQVIKSRKIKQIEEKIRENKEKIKKGVQNVVTIEMISEIEEEIINLETQFKELERVWGERIGNLEVEQSNRRIDEEKKAIILREKEREVKLNDIRLKQFRKLIVQARAKQKGDGDNTRQFRNKRNIKYLEKS